MSAFAPLNPNLPEIRQFVRLALAEDVGPGDVTSEALVPAGIAACATLRAKGPGVVAGLPLLQAVFSQLDPDIFVKTFADDGEQVNKGRKLAQVYGSARALLAGERTAVNFLQHLSGIATITRRFVNAAGRRRCRILDTRKTLPGLRLLAKYAVRAGGGTNHRMGLYDQALIKDNHLALARGEKNREALFAEVIRKARKTVPRGNPVEIEVTTVEEAVAAARGGADIVLLDNMPLPRIRQAVRKIREHRARTGDDLPLLEVSGGVTLAEVKRLAATGVDRISVGALTHSAPALDIAMEIQPMNRGDAKTQRKTLC